MKSLILTIILLIISTYSSGQRISLPIAPINLNLEYVNQTDSLGRKNGYWCESYGNFISLAFYEKGEKNGLEHVFYKAPGRNQYYLRAAGYNCSNVPAYQWQYYYETGTVSMLQTSISQNSDYLDEARNAGFHEPDSTQQCYIKLFDTDGRITSEGWLIFQDDVESEGVEVGIWKYYTNDGIIYKNML